MSDTLFHTDEFYTLKANVIALKEMLDVKHDTLKELIEEKFDAIEEATKKAFAANEARLEGMNEFRASLNDLSDRFPLKTELDPVIDNVQKDIKKLQISEATLAGKASQKSVNILSVFAVIGALSGLLALIIELTK